MLRLDGGAVFHPRQGDIFYTPRGSRFALQVDNPVHPNVNLPHGPRIVTNLCVKFLALDEAGQPARLGEFSPIVPPAALAGQCELLIAARQPVLGRSRLPAAFAGQAV